MDKKNTVCPFCGSDKIREREGVIHKAHPNKRIKIFRCQECSLDFFGEEEKI
jgi:transposase-like protein